MAGTREDTRIGVELNLTDEPETTGIKTKRNERNGWKEGRSFPTVKTEYFRHYLFLGIAWHGSFKLLREL